MSFWNDPSSHEPKRNYRFFVQNGEGIWWWVKTIDKPSVDISEGTYQLGNHTIKYPGVATWSDITMVIVDVDKRAQKLYQSLLDFGYNPKSPFLEDGISKKKSVDETKNTGNFLIQQIDSNGEITEEWTLYNPWFKSIKFSTMDYTNDDLSTIDITISYDYATITQ